MALSNLNKTTAEDLFKMLVLNENTDIEIIKKDYSSYSKLELLGKQIYNLQLEAKIIIDNAKTNDLLHKIPMTSKKIPGKFYYHYIFDNIDGEKELLSIIAPDEWNTYSKFMGKYLYNYDGLFYLQD